MGVYGNGGGQGCSWWWWWSEGTAVYPDFSTVLACDRGDRVALACDRGGRVALRKLRSETYKKG